MQHDQNDSRPVSTQADPTSPPASSHPLDRQHVLTSERESENTIFSQERSPVKLEIEKGSDILQPGRSPGWATRSL